MNGHLILTDGTEVQDIEPGDVEEALHAGKLLWVDLHDSSADSLALLKDVFSIHPLAVEDAAEFGQRPKLEEYDDFVSIIFFGANHVGQPMIEVHLFYGENFLVTLHRQPCVAFEGMRSSLQRHPSWTVAGSRVVLLHHVLDSLVDSVFPMLASFDDRIDSIQEQIFASPTEAQLSDLFDLKRWLVDVRKIVTPERDMLTSIVAGRVDLPGMNPQHEPYYRDLYDHLIRISDMVDSYRDLLSNSMETYMSMVSNRLNDVMKQLTIIATVFLPLSFLTGFFGQNFGWMVNHIGSLPAFFGIGIGTEVLAVVALYTLFKRRGWL